MEEGRKERKKEGKEEKKAGKEEKKVGKEEKMAGKDGRSSRGGAGKGRWERRPRGGGIAEEVKKAREQIKRRGKEYWERAGT
jgi:hypothetical protein